MTAKRNTSIKIKTLKANLTEVGCMYDQYADKMRREAREPMPRYAWGEWIAMLLEILEAAPGSIFPARHHSRSVPMRAKAHRRFGKR